MACSQFPFLSDEKLSDPAKKLHLWNGKVTTLTKVLFFSSFKHYSKHEKEIGDRKNKGNLPSLLMLLLEASARSNNMGINSTL